MSDQPADNDQEARSLTKADVTAIVTELKSSLIKDFYENLGNGVWALVKKALIWGVLALAIYGATNNHGWLKLGDVNAK